MPLVGDLVYVIIVSRDLCSSAPYEGHLMTRLLHLPVAGEAHEVTGAVGRRPSIKHWRHFMEENDDRTSCYNWLARLGYV